MNLEKTKTFYSKMKMESICDCATTHSSKMGGVTLGEGSLGKIPIDVERGLNFGSF